MVDESKKDHVEIFNLLVQVSCERDEGMEYGNLAVLEKLVQESMKRCPHLTEEQARGSILATAITNYAIDELGDKEEEDVWAEGQRRAKEKYGLLPAP